MTAEHNDELLPNGQDSVMVYFNPELLQSLADLSAEKRQNFQELLSAAEDGDLDAAYQLGQHYCRGTGGAPKDEAQGFRWFVKAADGDHIAAQYSLGMCWCRGIGTEKHSKKGAKLLSGAAEKWINGGRRSSTGRPPSRILPPPSATWDSSTTVVSA